MSEESGSISNRIKFLYSQYQIQTTAPSSKQIDFITKLGGEVKESATSRDAQKQIKFLLGSQKITSAQQRLLNSFPKKSIDEILHKDVIIEDVTKFELSRVIGILQTRNILDAKVYNHPIMTNYDYEYGWQESTKCPENKLYYIVFYNFLMVDIDGTLDIPALTAKLTTAHLTARLYRTYNGYHIFITSRPVFYKSEEALDIMETLGCDVFYTTFSCLNGFKVRLNPKLREDECLAAEYLETLGTEPENYKLLSLLALHDKYIVHHKKI